MNRFIVIHEAEPQMKIRILDLLVLTGMTASFMLMWRSPGSFLWIVVTLSTLFAVLVCHECIRLVSKYNHSCGDLLQAMKPHLIVWIFMWLFFFAGLELFLAFVLHGLYYLVSCFTAGWLSSLTTLSVVLAPRFPRMWTLLPLVYATSLLVTAAAMALATGFVYVLTRYDIVGGGYMGDEFALMVLSPMLAGGILIAITALAFFYMAKRQSSCAVPD